MSPSSSISIHFAARCVASQLTLGWTGRWSEPTGQHTLGLTLTNSSTTGCHLYGYPGVSFFDRAGRLLPLKVVWGGDQVVTSSPPVLVELPPGAAAYLVANKYRCDATDLMSAASVRIIPPDDTRSLELSILDNVAMDYCGPGDPGSIVNVSPVEPSLMAATTAQ